MSQADSQERCQRWLAQVNQACGEFDARALSGDVAGELEASHSGRIKLSTVTTCGINLFRTRNEISRSNDGWFYTVFQLEGEAVMAQQERQTLLQAGDMTLIDSALPCSFWWQGQSKQISLMLPRQLIEAPSRPTGAQRLGASQPLVQMCHRLVLESQRSSLSVAESDAALEAMVCLLRPMIKQETLPPRRERLFQNVLRFIDEHIQSEQLRPEWVAKENGMSLRSLYRMFADQGLVVAQFIKHRRLDLCARQLRLAAKDEKLATIGYEWGFTDQSHFSTAFRQRFGMSPGEYRKYHR